MSSAPASRSADAAELGSLSRCFQQGITSLDLARRKWAALTVTGRSTLTACVNVQLQLAHVHGTHWAPGFGAVRRGVEARALRDRREAQDRLPPVLEGLEAALANMHAAVSTMRTRLDTASRRLGAEVARDTPLLHTESARQILERSAELASSFDREWNLRRAMAAELLGAPGGVDDSNLYRRAGWEGTARLYLSAWVLEPYLDHDGMEFMLEGLAAEPQYVGSPSPAKRGQG